MRYRRLAILGALVTAVAVVPLMSEPAPGQDATGPRTPWGDPDLSGMWDFRTMTPLERPSELAGKEVLTDEEAAEYERNKLRELDKDLRVSDGLTAVQDVRNAYNQVWWDYGT